MRIGEIERKYGAFYEQHRLLKIHAKYQIEIVTCTIYIYDNQHGKVIYVGITRRLLWIRDKEHKEHCLCMSCGMCTYFTMCYPVIIKFGVLIRLLMLLSC